MVPEDPEYQQGQQQERCYADRNCFPSFFTKETLLTAKVIVVVCKCSNRVRQDNQALLTNGLLIFGCDLLIAKINEIC